MGYYGGRGGTAHDLTGSVEGQAPIQATHRQKTPAPFPIGTDHHNKDSICLDKWRLSRAAHHRAGEPQQALLAKLRHLHRAAMSDRLTSFFNAATTPGKHTTNGRITTRSIPTHAARMQWMCLSALIGHTQSTHGFSNTRFRLAQASFSSGNILWPTEWKNTATMSPTVPIVIVWTPKINAKGGRDHW